MRGVEQVPWLYDAGMVLLEKTGLGRWRSWLASGVLSGRVLDLGCGTGRNLPLFPAGVRAIGLDPCRESLLAARRRAPGVPLVHARAEALPFRDGAFDTVVSGLVFCSVTDVPRGLAEVRRVLKPGGVLRMLEHVRARGRTAARLQDLAQPAWTWFTGGCHPNRDTEAAVAGAGLAVDPATYRARGDLRRFECHPSALPSPRGARGTSKAAPESLPGEPPPDGVDARTNHKVFGIDGDTISNDIESEEKAKTVLPSGPSQEPTR